MTDIEQNDARGLRMRPGVDRPVVLAAGVAMFAAWVVFNWARIADDQNGIIRLALGFLFTALIILRPKQVRASDDMAGWPHWLQGLVAVGGVLCFASGLIFRVHQAEWLGILALFWAAATWVLPVVYRTDVTLSLLILYWMHPIPGQLFNPMELGMQRLSVLGAERLLGALNEPAWADGLVLRTGFRVFEVPAACSGMKTAITVLLCTISMGILRRMRPWETAGIIALGLVQVLALNIIRIAVLVQLGAAQTPDWSPRTLHNTVAVFLLIAVALLHIETALWLRWRKRRRAHRALEEADDFIGEPDERMHIFPRFWQLVFRWGRVGVAAAILTGGVFTLCYRNLPHHRAVMLAIVVRGLIVSDIDSAERAIKAGLKIEPENEDLRLAKIRILFLRRRFLDAIDEIRTFTPEEINVEVRVIEARSLFMLARITEAEAVMKRLPAEVGEWPGVAMLNAEIAAAHDQPTDVARNLRIAAQWPSLADRIYLLFPYLAVRQQWQPVVAVSAALDRPYRQPMQAVIAVNAALRLNNLGQAARAMRRGLNQWPREPLFLDSLLALAILRPGGEWEEQFARVFETTLLSLDTDTVARFAEACFFTVRPDLAWQAYRRLEKIDPQDPSLFVAPAQFAPQWFTFRRRFLGMSAEAAEMTVDLREFCRRTHAVEPWRSLWERVPLCEELMGKDIGAVQAHYCEACLTELQRREAAGKLTLRMERLYPRVLTMMGRPAEAHMRYDKLNAAHPEMRDQLLIERSGLYARERRWAEVYETTRAYRLSKRQPHLQSGLQMAEALIRLNLGPLAMAVLRDLQRAFPESALIRMALAETWSFYGFPEEALFALSHDNGNDKTPVMAGLLYRTGRVIAARKAASGSSNTEFPDRPQAFLPVPAEQAVTWVGQTFKPDEYKREADQIGSETLASPFVRDLRELTIDWLRMRGAGNISDPERWAGVGRDDQERALALHTLALMLARQGRQQDALTAVRRSTQFMPSAAVFWRLHAALSDGARDVITEARRNCPDDPELWIAELVSRYRAEGKGAWADAMIAAAVESHTFSPGTIVRAGDYFFRQGLLTAAERAARHAIRKGQGLLPAYVLGIRCALSQTNRPWALACALGAIENAVAPWSFYQLVVDLKVQDQKTDVDLVRALESLNAKFPDENKWAKRLGDIYFARGEMGNALGVLDQTLQKRGSKGLGVHSVLIAAEAARVEGKIEQAVEILRAARIDYPEDMGILNNLIYYLAQDQRTMPQALRLLPDLLTAKPSFGIMDTVALVYLRNGEANKAAEYMRKSLSLISKDNYAWHEMYLNAAEVYLAQDDRDGAMKMVEEVRKDPRRTAMVENRARALFDRMKR